MLRGFQQVAEEAVHTCQDTQNDGRDHDPFPKVKAILQPPAAGNEQARRAKEAKDRLHEKIHPISHTNYLFWHACPTLSRKNQILPIVFTIPYVAHHCKVNTIYFTKNVKARRFLPYFRLTSRRSWSIIKTKLEGSVMGMTHKAVTGRCAISMPIFTP